MQRRALLRVPPFLRPAATAAAAWSCVLKILHDAHRTSAPVRQSLDQHTCLDGRGGPRDSCTSEVGLHRSAEHQAGHLVFGQSSSFRPNRTAPPRSPRPAEGSRKGEPRVQKRRVTAIDCYHCHVFFLVSFRIRGIHAPDTPGVYLSWRDPEARYSFLARLSRVHRPFPRIPLGRPKAIASPFPSPQTPSQSSRSRRKPIGARFIHQGQNCRFSREFGDCRGDHLIPGRQNIHENQLASRFDKGELDGMSLAHSGYGVQGKRR